MSEYDDVHGDELASEVDDEGRNLTQQRIDERVPEERPVDAPWPTRESGDERGDANA